MSIEENIKNLKETKRMLETNIDLIYRENAAFLSDTQIEDEIYKDWYEDRIKPLENKISEIDSKIKNLES